MSRQAPLALPFADILPPVANKPFQALAAADLIAGLDVQYFNEFQ